MPRFSEISIKGHIARDAEVRQAGEREVVRLLLATQNSKKVGDGQWENVDDTMWWDIDIWDNDPIFALAARLAKGAVVSVRGRPSMRRYERKDGGEGFSLSVRFPEVAIIRESNADTRKAAVRDELPPLSYGAGTDDGIPF